MAPNSDTDDGISPQSPEEHATPPAPAHEESPSPSSPETAPAAEAESAVPAEASIAPEKSGEAVTGELFDSPPTPGAEGEAGEGPTDPLTILVERAQRGRLAPADEEKAAALVKEALLEGRKGVERIVEQLTRLPWVIGVSGVTAAWPEMKTTIRARLIGGLAKLDTDAARRVRLSLARGLFKLDVPAALKLATGVAKEIRDKETGAIHPKNVQIFANVLIGRAKPWVAQVVLADMKTADAELLVHCAMMSVFGMPHAPATQLGIIKWVAAADRLGKLQPAALEALIKGVGRWSGKWQGALRKEVTPLPEEILSVLKADGPAPAPAPAKPRRGERGEEGATGENAEDRGDVEAPEEKRDEEEDDDDDIEDDEDRDAEEEEERSGPPDRQRDGGSRQQQPQRPRPVYESKTVPSQPQQQQQRRQSSPGNFNLSETLKQIDAHVAGLRSELHATQSKLRQRDDELRKPRRNAPERAAGTIVQGELSMEELARLNRQLEARNTELQAHIQELAADSEDRAAAAGLAQEAAVAPDLQLRALLSLKLQEDYEDFSALEKEAPDLVVQQHYRTVLRHVFEVLRAEGVRLNEGQQ